MERGDVLKVARIVVPVLVVAWLVWLTVRAPTPESPRYGAPTQYVSLATDDAGAVTFRDPSSGAAKRLAGRDEALGGDFTGTPADGGVSKFAGLTPLQSEQGANVLRYGAIGNGTTDDTAAINAAKAALGASGGVLYFPAGRYLISSTIEIDTSVYIVGEGHVNVTSLSAGAEIRKAASLNGPAIRFNHVGGAQTIVVRGIAGNGGDGIVSWANGVTLRNVGVFAMGNDGIRIGRDYLDGGKVNASGWLLDHCTSSGNGRDGVHISDNWDEDANGGSVSGMTCVPDANAGTAIATMAQLNARDGFHVGCAQFDVFVADLGETNVRHGLYMSAGAGWHAVWGGDYEGNAVAQGGAGTLQIVQHPLSRQNRIDIPLVHEWTQLTVGSATPTIGAYDHWVAFQYGADGGAVPTTITNFLGAAKDQELTVRLDPNTTIAANANIKTRDSNYIGPGGNSNWLVNFRNINGVWFEQWRNFDQVISNYVYGSNDLTDSRWVASNATAADSQTLQDTSFSGTHYLYQTMRIATSAASTLAIELKAGTKSWAEWASGVNYFFAKLADCTVGLTSGSPTPTSLEDGWCRYTLAYTADNVTMQIYTANNNGVESYAGDGTGTILVRNVRVSQP